MRLKELHADGPAERCKLPGRAALDQARRDLFQYIEGFYNPRRLHSALGYISPADAKRRGR